MTKKCRPLPGGLEEHRKLSEVLCERITKDSREEDIRMLREWAVWQLAGEDALAEPTPEALAMAVLNVLDHDALAEKARR